MKSTILLQKRQKEPDTPLLDYSGLKRCGELLLKLRISVCLLIAGREKQGTFEAPIR